jgi:hydroxylamine reductase (hybrid-cluster protein)
VAGSAEDLKRQAEGTLNDAKGRAEGTYYDAKGRAEGTYSDAKGAAEEKKDQAKAGWFSWLGWGRAKADEVKEDAQWKADAVKHDAAANVEEKSSGLAAWASGKKAETVQEKDANVRRAGSYTSSV